MLEFPVIVRPPPRITYVPALNVTLEFPLTVRPPQYVPGDMVTLLLPLNLFEAAHAPEEGAWTYANGSPAGTMPVCTEAWKFELPLMFLPPTTPINGAVKLLFPVTFSAFEALESSM